MSYFKRRRENKLRNLSDEELDAVTEKYRKKSFKAMIATPTAICLGVVAYVLWPRTQTLPFPEEPQLMSQQKSFTKLISETEKFKSNVQAYTFLDSVGEKYHVSLFQRAKIEKSELEKDLDLIIGVYKSDSSNIEASEEFKNYYAQIDLRNKSIEDKNQENSVIVTYGLIFSLLAGAYSLRVKGRHDEVNKEYQSRAKARAFIIPDKFEI